MTKKRKDRNSSGNNSDNRNKCKQTKQRGPSDDSDDCFSISEILGKASAVLFPDVNNSEHKDTVGEVFCGAENSNSMAEGSREPTNKDLLDCMKAMGDKLCTMEKKLNSLDTLEKKVSSFEKELNKMWVAIEDRIKCTDAKLDGLVDRIETHDVEAALMTERVSRLEKQRDDLRDDVAYLKSQSMRNNLVFTNIPEDNTSGNEPADVTESKLRQHLQEKLKLAKETAESIRFERIHRSPGHPVQGRIRNVIAKFTFFKDRELVRREWKQLAGSGCQMYEQFPPEVMDKRRRLVPKMKDARKEGKRAWIIFDTLYVDGKPVRT